MPGLNKKKSGRKMVQESMQSGRGHLCSIVQSLSRYSLGLHLHRRKRHMTYVAGGIYIPDPNTHVLQCPRSRETIEVRRDLSRDVRIIARRGRHKAQRIRGFGDDAEYERCDGGDEEQQGDEDGDYGEPDVADVLFAVLPGAGERGGVPGVPGIVGFEVCDALLGEVAHHDCAAECGLPEGIDGDLKTVAHYAGGQVGDVDPAVFSGGLLERGSPSEGAQLRVHHPVLHELARRALCLFESLICARHVRIDGVEPGL